MQEGKRVRRPLWIRSAWYAADGSENWPKAHLFRGRNKRLGKVDLSCHLLIEDLLADDWEIAE